MAADQSSARPRDHAMPPLPYRRLLADSVYEAVKALVLDDALAPGERVSIERLARELAVSPTPLREALARLESDGLVRKVPMRGYSVTPVLTTQEFEELYELRLLLEPWAARRAAERADGGNASQLRAEIDRFLVDGGTPSTGHAAYRALADHDSRLHSLVLAGAGNSAVALAYERTRCHLHLFRLYYRPHVRQQTVTEHRRVVDAIVAGDADAADTAMSDHLVTSRARMAAMLRRRA